MHVCLKKADKPCIVAFDEFQQVAGYAEKNVEAISKDSETIKKVCRDIDEQCDKINRNYISQIQEKINKFSLKLDRNIVKKL